MTTDHSANRTAHWATYRNTKGSTDDACACCTNAGAHGTSALFSSNRVRLAVGIEFRIGVGVDNW